MNWLPRNETKALNQRERSTPLVFVQYNVEFDKLYLLKEKPGR